VSDVDASAPDQDWRELVAFETPTRVDVAYPWMRGPDWREVLWCSSCGGGSPVREGSELWAVKHHHAGQPLGHLRFYCREHLPQREWTSSEGGHDGTGRVGAVCPTCFTTLPLTGVCDSCG
jgi:hypothetical protein